MFHLNVFLFKKKSLETFQDSRLEGSVSFNKGEAVEGDRTLVLLLSRSLLVGRLSHQAANTWSSVLCP